MLLPDKPTLNWALQEKARAIRNVMAAVIADRRAENGNRTAENTEQKVGTANMVTATANHPEVREEAVTGTGNPTPTNGVEKVMKKNLPEVTEKRKAVDVHQENQVRNPGETEDKMVKKRSNQLLFSFEIL
jgi:hypothetical protein